MGSLRPGVAQGAKLVGVPCRYVQGYQVGGDLAVTARVRRVESVTEGSVLPLPKLQARAAMQLTLTVKCT